MSNLVTWRRVLGFAMIDALLVVTAGAASAATAATRLPAASPALPALVLLGVGLVGATWTGRARF